MSRKTKRIGIVGAVAALATLAASAVAGAATTACPSVKLLTPFTAFGDKNTYFVAPGGTFESATLTGWTLSGASRIAGNESYNVSGSKDAYSLSIPAGAKAQTPFVCVPVAAPTMRFFVRNTGVSTATLKVEVIFVDPLGKQQTVTVKSDLTAGSAWQPTPEILYYANLVGLFTSTQTTNVSFRFTAGTGGTFQIDDVYVDPRKSF